MEREGRHRGTVGVTEVLGERVEKNDSVLPRVLWTRGGGVGYGYQDLEHQCPSSRPVRDLEKEVR